MLRGMGVPGGPRALGCLFGSVWTSTTAYWGVLGSPGVSVGIFGASFGALQEVPKGVWSVFENVKKQLVFTLFSIVVGTSGAAWVALGRPAGTSVAVRGPSGVLWRVLGDL